jgi:hypothetical protein
LPVLRDPLPLSYKQTSNPVAVFELARQKARCSSLVEVATPRREFSANSTAAKRGTNSSLAAASMLRLYESSKAHKRSAERLSLQQRSYGSSPRQSHPHSRERRQENGANHGAVPRIEQQTQRASVPQSCKICARSVHETKTIRAQNVHERRTIRAENAPTSCTNPAQS